MQYTVVHSTDPYLLARLATDLQMSGVEISRFTSTVHWCHPWDDSVFEWVYLSIHESETVEFGLANHDCSCVNVAIRHELTPRNYIKVLTQILEP